MKDDQKKIIVLLGFIIGYILLGVLGVYEVGGILIFPLISLPLALYLIRNKEEIKKQFIYHGIIAIGIYAITGSIYNLLVYIVGICIPAYAISYFYKKRIPIPNVIMNVTLIMSIAFFAYFSFMKAVGIDYEAQFIALLDQLKEVPLANINEYITASNLGSTMSAADLELLQINFKTFINTMIDTLKNFYPSFVLLQVLIFTSISVILLNILLRKKDKHVPSLRQLLNFRISKFGVLLLFISMIGVDMSMSMGSASTIISLNLMFFLSTLLQIVGALALFAIIQRAPFGKGIKIIGYILVVILFSASPYLLMFFGCFDAIFNYRKVTIIV